MNKQEDRVSKRSKNSKHLSENQIFNANFELISLKY